MFQNIWTEMDGKIGEAECSRMSVFAINSIISPEGLCPMLLVYVYELYGSTNAPR